MKNIFKLLLLATGILLVYSSCNKIDNLYKVSALPVYQNGVSPVLSSNITTVAPAVGDSDKAAISFSWTDPKYASDSNTTKYIIQVDSSGRNFAKAFSYGLNIPFIGVNHMEAHIYSNFIGDPKPDYPFLCLIVSGCAATTNP